MRAEATHAGGMKTASTWNPSQDSQVPAALPKLSAVLQMLCYNAFVITQC
jgi:hypothetical protein